MYKEGLEAIAAIPDYSYFWSMDEFDRSSFRLAETYPDTVSIFEMGKTREKRPIHVLKIGNGSRNVLMMGCPHPNEPIGSMMLEHFSTYAASDPDFLRRYPYTFYIIKVWDVDGYVLNEKWLRGPFTITNYTRNMFRPAGNEQVDWTFPIDYKLHHFHDSIPEALEMKKLIDDIRPFFIYSLHNSGFGGAYWYLSEDLPEVYDVLHQIPPEFSMPCSLGEAESPSSIKLADAIYQCGGFQNTYDYVEKYGDPEQLTKFRSGDNSASYAYRNYGSFSLMAELPYFYEARVDDMSPSGITRREGVRIRTERGAEMTREIRSILELSLPYLTDNPYARTVDNFNPVRSTRSAELNQAQREDYSRRATVAEEMDFLYVSTFYKLTSYGMLVQANELTLERLKQKGETDTDAARAVTEALEKAKAAFDRVASQLEKDLNYKMIPIRNMVSLQLKSGLAVMEALENRKEGCQC